MAQTQTAANPDQSLPIPLGFCRVVADVIRRILRDREDDGAEAQRQTSAPEHARTGE